MRINSRFTPFATVALKFAAGYVIVAAYWLPPRRTSAFFRLSKLCVLANSPFLLPGLSFLFDSILSDFLLDSDRLPLALPPLRPRSPLRARGLIGFGLVLIARVLSSSFQVVCSSLGFRPNLPSPGTLKPAFYLHLLTQKY